MFKKSLINVGVMSALGVVANSAMAGQGTLINNSSTNTVFAQESFYGTGTTATIAASNVSAASLSGLVANQTVSFTLSNATFPSCPNLYLTNNLTPATYAGTLGNSNKTCTYTVTAQVLEASGVTLQLGAFNMGGLSPSSLGSAVPTTVALASAFPGGAAADTTNTTRSLATGTAAVTFTVDATNANTAAIDILHSGQAKQWYIDSQLQAYGQLGTFTINAVAGANSDGTGAFTLGASDERQIVITGNAVSSLSSVWLQTGACTATPGSIAGTPSGGSVTISNVGLVVGTAYRVCGKANGTSLIVNGQIKGQGNVNYVARTTNTPGNVSITPKTVPQTPSNMVLMASNGTISNASVYVVGATSGYGSYLYATNPTGVTNNVFVSARTQNGTVAFGQLASTVAANSSLLITPQDINLAVGQTILQSAADRANVTLYTGDANVAGQPGATLTVTNLLLNPDGSVQSVISNQP